MGIQAPMLVTNVRNQSAISNRTLVLDVVDEVLISQPTGQSKKNDSCARRCQTCTDKLMLDFGWGEGATLVFQICYVTSLLHKNHSDECDDYTPYHRRSSSNVEVDEGNPRVTGNPPENEYQYSLPFTPLTARPHPNRPTYESVSLVSNATKSIFRLSKHQSISNPDPKYLHFSSSRSPLD